MVRRLLPVLLLLPAPAAVSAQQNGSGRTAWYSEPQAARGADVFRRNCLSCHPAGQFVGAAFEKARAGQPLSVLFEQLRTTMPQDEPGRLTAQEYTDVIVYLLKQNGYPVGSAEIPADGEALAGIRFRAAKPQNLDGQE